ncbi:MAG: hypothetical protein AAB512_04235 [Patescibacteria group bacterium]
MATLGETSAYIKKYILPLVFFLLIPPLLYLIFLKVQGLKTPTSPSIPRPAIEQNTDKSASSFKVEAAFPKIPDKLPTYNLKPTELSDEQASTTAKSFGLDPKPTLKENTYSGIQYSFNTPTHDLEINKKEIRYTNKTLQNSTGQKPTEELIGAASGFLNNLGFLPFELTINSSQTNYQKIQGDAYVSAPKDSAQFIEFSFDLNIGAYKVLTNSRQPSFAKIKVSQDGNVIEANITYPFSFDESESYKLKNKQTALSELNAKKAVITSAFILDKFGQANDLYNLNVQEIGTVTIKNIYLAYFYTNKPDGTIQPIYVFEGNFTTSKGAPGSVIMYLPAVSP